ncbi:unnamed protein product [Fasciola hepatica]|uniref:Uncharacterized protein n=1 Tax=Fasciola hepatica TaxID=6192 RepID=A0ABC9HHT6_FASHE
MAKQAGESSMDQGATSGVFSEKKTASLEPIQFDMPVLLSVTSEKPAPFHRKQTLKISYFYIIRRGQKRLVQVDLRGMKMWNDRKEKHHSAMYGVRKKTIVEAYDLKYFDSNPILSGCPLSQPTEVFQHTK